MIGSFQMQEEKKEPPAADTRPNPPGWQE